MLVLAVGPACESEPSYPSLSSPELEFPDPQYLPDVGHEQGPPCLAESLASLQLRAIL